MALPPHQMFKVCRGWREKRAAWAVSFVLDCCVDEQKTAVSVRIFFSGVDFRG
jgi:NADH:ubiquinone oxidoreductase subunit B-like Fe-S oxidoreductase